MSNRIARSIILAAFAVAWLSVVTGCHKNPTAAHLKTIQDPTVFMYEKVEALRELQKTGPLDSEAQRIVGDALLDTNFYVRKEAAAALKAGGDENALPALERAREAETFEEAKTGIEDAINAIRQRAGAGAVAAPTQPAASEPADVSAMPDITPPLDPAEAPVDLSSSSALPPLDPEDQMSPAPIGEDFEPIGDIERPAAVAPPSAVGDDTVSLQIEQLNNPDPQKRIVATVMIRILGNSSHVPALQAALERESNAMVRGKMTEAIEVLSGTPVPAAAVSAAPAPPAAPPSLAPDSEESAPAPESIAPPPSGEPAMLKARGSMKVKAPESANAQPAATPAPAPAADETAPAPAPPGATAIAPEAMKTAPAGAAIETPETAAPAETAAPDATAASTEETPAEPAAVSAGAPAAAPGAKLVSVEVSPKAIKPGEKASMVALYQVSGLPPGARTEVVETRKLLFGGNVVKEFDPTTTQAENQEYRSSVPLEVPPAAPAGEYVLRCEIQAFGETQTLDCPFEIAP